MVVIVMLLVVLFCGSATAQTGASLEMCLSNVAAEEPASATITLWPLNKSQHVDSWSRIVFDNLPAGQYRVEIAAENYATWDTTVDIGSGEYMLLEMEMHRIAAIMPEVAVEGVRQTAAMRVFNRKEIESSAARSLPDFLHDVAGLELRSDGDPGGTIVPRIGGSLPEHVLVLVDGRRLQHLGSGEADLSAIPLEWIESVEISRGGNTEIGGEAIGGVLNIATRAGENSDLRANAEFHPTFTRASFLRSGNFGSISSFISVVRTQGPGNFTYTFTEEDGNGRFSTNYGKSFRRINADVTRDQLLGKIQTQLKHLGRIEVCSSIDYTNRGMPGYLAPQLTPEARQNSHQEAVNVRLRQNRKSFSIENRASYQQDWRHYVNPDSQSLINESLEASRQWDIESRGNLILRRYALSAGFSTSREVLSSDDISSGHALRSRIAAWTSLCWTAIGDSASGISIKIHPGLRWERFNEKDALLPNAILTMERRNGIYTRCEMNWGCSYHAPSLYSLFWLDDKVSQGNPDLRAETSNEFSGKLHFETLAQDFTSIELSASNQTVYDLIYWKQTFDGRWKPFNMKNALVRTLETSLEQSLVRNHLKVNGGLTWTEARNATADRNTGGKYLTFRAPRTQRLGLQLHAQQFTFTSTMRWVSSRPALEDNSKWLRAYRLMNINLAYTFNLKQARIEPVIGLENALNENYRLIRFAPMPKREWFAAIRIIYQ